STATVARAAGRCARPPIHAAAKATQAMVARSRSQPIRKATSGFEPISRRTNPTSAQKTTNWRYGRAEGPSNQTALPMWFPASPPPTLGRPSKARISRAYTATVTVRAAPARAHPVRGVQWKRRAPAQAPSTPTTPPRASAGPSARPVVVRRIPPAIAGVRRSSGTSTRGWRSSGRKGAKPQTEQRCRHLHHVAERTPAAELRAAGGSRRHLHRPLTHPETSQGGEGNALRLRVFLRHFRREHPPRTTRVHTKARGRIGDARFLPEQAEQRAQPAPTDPAGASRGVEPGAGTGEEARSAQEIRPGLGRASQEIRNALDRVLPVRVALNDPLRVQAVRDPESGEQRPGDAESYGVGHASVRGLAREQRLGTIVRSIVDHHP